MLLQLARRLAALPLLGFLHLPSWSERVASHCSAHWRLASFALGQPLVSIPRGQQQTESVTLEPSRPLVSTRSSLPAIFPISFPFKLSRARVLDTVPSTSYFPIITQRRITLPRCLLQRACPTFLDSHHREIAADLVPFLPTATNASVPISTFPSHPHPPPSVLVRATSCHHCLDDGERDSVIHRLPTSCSANSLHSSSLQLAVDNTLSRIRQLYP